MERKKSKHLDEQTKPTRKGKQTNKQGTQTTTTKEGKTLHKQGKSAAKGVIQPTGGKTLGLIPPLTLYNTRPQKNHRALKASGPRD